MISDSMENVANPPIEPAVPAGKLRRTFKVLAAGAVILFVLAAIGIFRRHAKTQELRAVADAAEQHVTIIHPEMSPGVVNLVLPGQTEAFTQAPIYAQTNGYLKKWYFDIGARVKAGDVLAEIDTPTVDQQLAQAEAQLAESQASLKLAESTYARQQALVKRNVISQQDFDDATSDLQTRQSNVNAEAANVKQLRAQQDFKILRAPFDGVVSARNTDIGALIRSGSDTPLFVVSQMAPLRVYIQVPEAMAALVKNGTKANLTFDTFPGRDFPAEVVANAGAIDKTSRTLLVQLAVPNANEELFPGAYTQVHLRLENPNPTLRVPANVLLFRAEGAAVGVVDAQGRVEIRNIKIGRDFGNHLEVVQGISASDQVIINPPDSLLSGDQVKVTMATPEPSPSPKTP